MALTSTSYTETLQIQRDGSPEFTITYGSSLTIGLLVKVSGTAYDLTGITSTISISKYRTDTTPTILNEDDCTNTVTTGLLKYNITPTISDTMTRGNYKFWITVPISSGITKKIFEGVIIVK